MYFYSKLINYSDKVRSAGTGQGGQPEAWGHFGESWQGKGWEDGGRQQGYYYNEENMSFTQWKKMQYFCFATVLCDCKIVFC